MGQMSRIAALKQRARGQVAALERQRARFSRQVEEDEAAELQREEQSAAAALHLADAMQQLAEKQERMQKEALKRHKRERERVQQEEARQEQKRQKANQEAVLRGFFNADHRRAVQEAEEARRAEARAKREAIRAEKAKAELLQQLEVSRPARPRR